MCPGTLLGILRSPGQYEQQDSTVGTQHAFIYHGRSTTVTAASVGGGGTQAQERESVPFIAVVVVVDDDAVVFALDCSFYDTPGVRHTTDPNSVLIILPINTEIHVCNT